MHVHVRHMPRRTLKQLTVWTLCGHVIHALLQSLGLRALGMMARALPLFLGVCTCSRAAMPALCTCAVGRAEQPASWWQRARRATQTRSALWRRTTSVASSGASALQLVADAGVEALRAAAHMCAGQGGNVSFASDETQRGRTAPLSSASWPPHVGEKAAAVEAAVVGDGQHLRRERGARHTCGPRAICAGSAGRPTHNVPGRASAGTRGRWRPWAPGWACR